MNGVVEKINNERITLLWTYQNNSKIEVKLCHNQMLEYLGKQRNAKLHFKIKRRINCTSRCEKKKYLNSTDKNLDEHLKNELNHEEPP